MNVIAGGAPRVSFGYPEVEGVAVVVRYNEPLDKAVRRFRKLVQRTGVLSDAKRHRWFETRSQRRRRRDRQATHWRARAAS